MIDTKLTAALTAVLDEAGFEKAASRLGITQSAVSQRLRLLEEQLGAPVLVRSNPPRPTAVGQVLLRHHRKVAQLEEELWTDLRANTAGPTRLAVAVNADSLATWFLEAVQPLIISGRIMLDIHVDDQDVTEALLHNGEVVGCISTRKTQFRGCECRRLGRMDYLCVATPAFAERWFPEGLTVSSLTTAPAVVFNRKDAVHDRFLGAVFGHVCDKKDAPRHYVPSSESFVDFILAHCAYGLVPQPQAQKHLDTATLVNLSPGNTCPVHLYWHVWNIGSRVLEELTDCLVGAWGTDL
ncbi:LysR family transcriptional regulator ArgP [Desulfovibrio inopinatus]|uniref:LysR family transcriptional regulator ArgP n=1 Tax=Desulfovibrio inopinatus TaxID=102109 RepID=UPI0003FCAF49|nr:LysR family transcriptional regulator ArgP [Desulfovibrio inopinatus]